MDKEEKMFLASVDDRCRRRDNSNILTSTGFLSQAELSLACAHLRAEYASFFAWGGYDEAERKILAFLPEYMTEEDVTADDGPLSVLRVSIPKGAGPLSHRDYLGSVLALGIRRELVGDILVCEDGADLIVLSEMADYLAREYGKAGRVNLSCRIVPLSQLRISSVKTEELSDTLASLRLDSLAASAFGLSRTRAQEAIRQGLLFINDVQIQDPDRPVEQGDRIVFRGRGKCVLSAVGGTSKKGRTFVTIRKYL